MTRPSAAPPPGAASRGGTARGGLDQPTPTALPQSGAAAALIANLLQKHPWIAYLGLVVIAWVAVSMIFEGGLAVVEAVEVSGLL